MRKSWSSTSSCSTELTTHDLDETMYSYLVLLSEFSQLEGSLIKEKRIGEILCRAASHGDIQTLEQILTNEHLSPFLNLDATDEEGSTPLIYASCFGKLQVVKYLLEQGAQVNVQDKIGWTALMWATTNNHHETVQVLLDYSASSETKSSSGRTIYDLVDMENDKIFSILNPLTHELERRKSARQRTDEEIKKDAFGDESVHKFAWDHCLPDQMFVFAEQKLNHVLDIAITKFTLPLKSRAEIYVPVNIIFLSARYAHYFTSRELLHQLLSKAVKRIDHIIKSNSSDIHTLAFWIANLSQLLYYLKKDAGLVVATAEHQLEISELISETYTLLVLDSEKRLERILEPAMLEYEEIDGLESIDFADDWHRFFRRSRTSLSSPSSPKRLSFTETRTALSPQSITSLLSSILYVLQSYDVHPVIVIQAIAQLFHFISCEIFNRILSNKKFLCRSRAIQIRMNLTTVQEWIRDHHLPNTLSEYLGPIVQLLQLLQCVSQLSDLLDFITTMKSFDLLNPMQVKRLVLNYRYEVSEPKLPEEIEKYTMQTAQDTRKSIDGVEEKRDSNYMLPFSLPTTTNMIHTGWPTQQHQDLESMSLSDRIYFELKQKRVKSVKERSVIPNIPEEWLVQLDVYNNELKQ